MDACPEPCIFACRCQLSSRMIHMPDATFYPHIMFFRVENCMYNARGFVLGRHFWEQLIQNSYDIGRSVHVWPSYNYHRLNGVMIVKGIAVMLNPTVAGVLPVVFVRRIQRTFRRRLLERRMLAAMLASHIRLGIDSLLASVPEDLMRTLIFCLR